MRAVGIALAFVLAGVLAHEASRAWLKESWRGLVSDQPTTTREQPLVWPRTPRIDALVTRVKSNVSPALVLLNGGEDQAIEKGYHFAIYRSKKFIGRVFVEKVLRDQSGCRVLFTTEGESVEPGDRAVTRLE